MDNAFFVVSKLGWALIRPDSLIIIGLALTVAGAALGRRRLAFWAGGPLLATLVVLAFLPLGDLLIRPLEARYPVAPPLSDVTGIIVLGGGEETGRALVSGLPQVNDAGERFIAAAALARAWPDARVVFSGGSGLLFGRHGAVPSNAAMSLEHLAFLGIDPARIELEEASRNTAENASLTLARVRPKPGETWVLVTSAFHMPRAVQSFAAAGWTGIVPWPVDHRAEPFPGAVRWDLTDHLQTLNIAVREYTGLQAYRLTGR